MSKLRKFLALRPRQQHLLFRTYGLLNGTRIGLWLLPFMRLRRALGAISQRSAVSDEPHTINQIVWAINLSCRYSPGRPKCLARALTAQVLMYRQGYPAALKIGVLSATQGQIEAHAWVEYDGNVVIGALENLPSFTPLPSLEKI